MSDDLRVRLFLEQVEEVERLLQHKQKAVDDITLALDGIKGEIADRKRVRVRQAALAAVAAAKTAQQDAEIKLAEEQLCLLEEESGTKATKEPAQAVEHCLDAKKPHTHDDAQKNDRGTIDDELLAKEKLKLANEEAKVAKAKELLAAMNFEEQLAKLQEKLRGLEEKEARAEQEHDEASNALRAVLGDVDSLPDCTTTPEGDLWPDENVLNHPARTLADSLKLLQSLGAQKKVRATWDVVRKCQRYLCKPAATPEEDTESVTEPAVQEKDGQDGAEDKVVTVTPEGQPNPVHCVQNSSQDGDSDAGGELDVEKLRALFADPEPLSSGTKRLQQATERVESARKAQSAVEARISELLAEKQKRCAAIKSMDEEVKRQRITLSELADFDV